MSGQIIIVCDEKGNPTGEYIPKEVGHTGDGKHHLAITVLLVNNKGQVLLQKRKHKVFDNIWDFTASTHPLHTDGTDETLEEATLRALKDEYGIREVGELREVGSFNYFAKIDGLCENEHDHLLVGEYNGDIELNSQHGYECKWVNKQEMLQDMEGNPQKYSAWSLEGLKVLKHAGFFN